METALEQSGLPEAAQILIRQVAGQQPECLDMAEVDRLITAQKAVLAEVAQPNVVTGMRPITGRELRTGLDDMQEALDWCLGVQGGPTPAPSLRNIRDVYLAITGDVDFYGAFNREHSQLTRGLDRHAARPGPQQPQQGRAPALRQPGDVPVVRAHRRCGGRTTGRRRTSTW